MSQINASMRLVIAMQLGGKSIDYFIMQVLVGKLLFYIVYLLRSVALPLFRPIYVSVVKHKIRIIFAIPISGPKHVVLSPPLPGARAPP